MRSFRRALAVTMAVAAVIGLQFKPVFRADWEPWQLSEPL
jgi:hypothetical protein